MRLFLVISIIFAQSLAFSAVNLPNKKVSFNVMNEGVKTTLSMLLDKEGIKYEFSEDVVEKKKIYIEVADAQWKEVFDFIVEQNGLSYTADEGGTLHFAARR